MAFFRRWLLLFLLALAAPLSAQTGDSGWFYRGSDIPPDPAWQFGTLPNGLRYVIRRNALPAHQVSIRVRIDAGSLNETDAERGWAHFVEHLVFRGTRSFGDREARHIWEELGASFGSDTNATTQPSQTVYQLDLPRSDKAALDRSLDILAEMMDTARFDPAAVDGERKIVLAEKRRRPEISDRFDQVARPLFYAGLKYADRDPIGTERTIAAATPAGLRAFYERWYRPEHATVIMVGDEDPAVMEAMIRSHFGAWQPDGPSPRAPDYGRIAAGGQRVATLVYAGAPYTAQLMWVRPYDDSPDTIALERAELSERLAAQIVNRRLEAKARKDAAFVVASLGVARLRHIADVSQLSITAKDARWRDSLNQVFAILADSRRAPPRRDEIARELANLRAALLSGVTGESTIQSQQWAQQMVGALNSGDVATTAKTMVEMLDRLAPQMTPARVALATRRLLNGAGPRLLLLTPEPVRGSPAMVQGALAAAEKMPPARREGERSVSFSALPPLGSPGREVARQRIEDMGVTIVRFANGSTLTFKQTDFQKGSVSVELRFGNGLGGLPADRPSLSWASDVITRSGLADLDLDAMERLMTGRVMNIDFGMAEDSSVMAGTTNAADLPDQLRLLATKLAYPRWDDTLFNRFKAGWLENYELSFASASARAGREMGGVLHPGDPRWQPPSREDIVNASPEAFRAEFEPILAGGPIETIIVGDVDFETALAAVTRTVAALPARPPATPVTQVLPPRPSEPKQFTHSGDPNQAYALIGWSTIGGITNILQRRALSVGANMLQVRLFDELREQEGATYSPSANATSSEEFPAWGVFAAAAEVKPDNVATFFRIARAQVADLAAKVVQPDEFQRAHNPIVSGIERRLKTNGYWVGALEDWPTKPELIEQTRHYLSDYRDMTPEKVRAALAAYVTDEGDWSMLVLPDKNRTNGN